ncbi:MAG: MucR family transcriptional regulator [Hyphomonadaceae bacterium]
MSPVDKLVSATKPSHQETIPNNINPTPASAGSFNPFDSQIPGTALITLSSDDFEKPTDKPKAAVSLAKSITDDFIICLEDGKKLKMLKRYLRSKYNLSPEEYRRRWSLPADYPMVAPNYAKRRSEFARQIGLGRGVRGR